MKLFIEQGVQINLHSNRVTLEFDEKDGERLLKILQQLLPKPGPYMVVLWSDKNGRCENGP